MRADTPRTRVYAVQGTWTWVPDGAKTRRHITRVAGVLDAVMPPQTRHLEVEDPGVRGKHGGQGR